MLWDYAVYGESPSAADSCELEADVHLYWVEKRFEDELKGKIAKFGGRLLDIHCFVKTVSDAKKAAQSVHSAYWGCNASMCNCEACCESSCAELHPPDSLIWYDCTAACKYQCCEAPPILKPRIGGGW